MNKEIDKKRCGANVEKVIIDEFVPSKAIDNANPSEAMNCIEKVNDYLSDVYDYKEIKEAVQKDINTVEQALLKAQEQEKENVEYKKVLEILKPDLRLVGNFLQARMPLVEDNDRWIIVKEITNKEELELLKKILGQTQI